LTRPASIEAPLPRLVRIAARSRPQSGRRGDKGCHGRKMEAGFNIKKSSDVIALFTRQDVLTILSF
jgi:hypothetical protein